MGWVALEFVARPIRRFYDLRAEIIQTMAQYGNLRAQTTEHPNGSVTVNVPPLTGTELAVLDEARRAIRGLAARMRSFAYGETIAHWLLSFRYNPHKASDGLFGYSNLFDTYGGEKAAKKEMIEEALRLPKHLL